MGEFLMPSLGADMDEGTVLEWLVKPGDVVRRGDIVAVVDTDKSAVDVETFEGGRVESLLVEPGRRVQVGTPLAVISTTETAVLPPRIPAPAPPPPVPTATVTTPPSPTPLVSRASPPVRSAARARGIDLSQVAGTGRGGRVTHADVTRAAEPRARVTPLARRRAAELGVDLTTVTGTGAHGAIVAIDVDRAAALASSSGRPERRPKAGQAPQEEAVRRPDRRPGLRRATARLMTRSNAEVPQYHLLSTIDVTEPTQWLHERNQGRQPGERILVAALLCRATVLAAREFPTINGWWVDDDLHPAEHVHLGLAVSVRGGGLVTPVIRDADQLALPELMTAMRDVAERARAGRLRRTELTDATLTVTNLGERGAEVVMGVLFPPQVALVGFGTVVERPWAIGHLLGVRTVVTVTLTGDHRASDGHEGSRFLEAVGQRLIHPEDQ